MRRRAVVADAPLTLTQRAIRWRAITWFAWGRKISLMKLGSGSWPKPPTYPKMTFAPASASSRSDPESLIVGMEFRLQAESLECATFRLKAELHAVSP